MEARDASGTAVELEQWVEPYWGGPMPCRSDGGGLAGSCVRLDGGRWSLSGQSRTGEEDSRESTTWQSSATASPTQAGCQHDCIGGTFSAPRLPA
jgi:hypothetical protein